MIREAFVNKARWLIHVDLLVERPLKKGIVNIKLADGPSLSNCQGEDDPNCHWFDDGAKCFCVVTTRALMETFSDQSSLVPINGPIWISLDAKDPLTTNQIRSRGTTNEFPGVVAM